MKEFNIMMDVDLSLEAVSASKPRVFGLDIPKDKRVLQACLKANSKSSALTQYHARVKSGLIVPKSARTALNKNIEKIKKALDSNTNMQTNKAIFCDFNGVLDEFGKESTESNLKFKLPKLACPDKIVRLVNLAIKHNAKMVFISEHRKFGIGLKVIIGRCLLHNSTEEHKKFYNDNKRKISELTQVRSTPVRSSRSQEIKEYILDEGITHCVVFEDNHPILPELNPVMTEWNIGLLDKHIEKADKFLS